MFLIGKKISSQFQTTTYISKERFELIGHWYSKLLPNPPSDEDVSKSLAVTEKILEEVTVKNNQLANITSVKVGDEERNDIRQTIDKTCSDQTKTQVVVDKPAEEPRPQVFFRVRRRKRETTAPQPITNAQESAKTNSIGEFGQCNCNLKTFTKREQCDTFKTFWQIDQFRRWNRFWQTAFRICCRAWYKRSSSPSAQSPIISHNCWKCAKVAKKQKRRLKRWI